MPKSLKHIFICIQSRPENHPRGSCASKGGIDVFQEFMQQFDTHKLYDRYALVNTGCLGPCDMGPSVLIYPEGVMYKGIKKTDVVTIIEEHLLGGKPVERLMMADDTRGSLGIA
jgi:(2Fe-2S) ferredoxin